MNNIKSTSFAICTLLVALTIAILWLVLAIGLHMPTYEIAKLIGNWLYYNFIFAFMCLCTLWVTIYAILDTIKQRRNQKFNKAD